LNAALAVDPGDVPALQARGYALWQLAREEEAQQDFASVLSRSPQQETTLLYAAGLAATLGRTSDALGYWQRLLEVNPYSAHYHYRLAHFHADQGDLQKARTEFQAALQLNPAHLDARLLLALCSLRLGERQAARDQFAIVLAMHPANEAALRKAYGQLLR
jgi:tetratricopeptide (TPR) repeat protein